MGAAELELARAIGVGCHRASLTKMYGGKCGRCTTRRSKRDGRGARPKRTGDATLRSPRASRPTLRWWVEPEREPSASGERRKVERKNDGQRRSRLALGSGIVVPAERRGARAMPRTVRRGRDGHMMHWGKNTQNFFAHYTITTQRRGDEGLRPIISCAHEEPENQGRCVASALTQEPPASISSPQGAKV